MPSNTPVVPRKYLALFILLTSCFALWGLLNNMTDNLVPAFQKIFTMDQSRAGLVQVAFYGAYGVLAVFASVLTGALVKGKTLHEAVRLAEAFVRECAIQTMPQNIPAREGVDFEPILWKLHEGL